MTTVSAYSANTTNTKPFNTPDPAPMHLDNELTCTGEEDSVFRLLCELNRLLRQLFGASYEQKALQSFYTLQLQMQSAVAIQKIGDEKRWMGFCRAAGTAVAGIIAFAAQNSHVFAPTSTALGELVSLESQSNITDNEVINKKNDAYIQSTQAVQDGMMKQIDQLIQMLREPIQTAKETKDARYQALAQIARM